jgi:hypothetical protein
LLFWKELRKKAKKERKTPTATVLCLRSMLKLLPQQVGSRDRFFGSLQSGSAIPGEETLLML